MKILHVISSGGLYGAEAVILNLARAFANGPHSIVLGIFENASNPNRQLYDVAVREEIETYLIPCSGQVDYSAVMSIRRLADSLKADLVHSHGYKADVYCFLALRRQSIPLVSTCHNWIETSRILKLYGKIDRMLLRRFTAVVAVSEDVRSRLVGAGVSPNRIYIVRNGVDMRPYARAVPSARHGLAPGVLLVGLVGRLSWEKGVDIFLAAASRVHAQMPNVHFVVIGDGPDRGALESMRDSLGLQPYFRFLGRRDDMPSVYASLDLMVSASRQEGLPIALLEGMASGLPIIATSVGEVPSVVQAGQSGILVPPNDPGALAAAVLELLNDPDQRNRFSSKAREVTAAEFSADRMAGDYAEVYEDVATPTSQSPGVTRDVAPSRPPKIFMMDLWAILPYYVAYLSQALLEQGADLTVGSITYYLDTTCYSSRGLRLRPGLINLVGRFRLPRTPRRVLKFAESLVNLLALTIRFAFSPPDVLHVQFLPMLTSRIPIDYWFIRYSRLRGSRVVLTVHDLLPHDTGAAHKETFLKLYSRMDALICHSSEIRDRLVSEFSVSSTKVSIIPHGPFFYDLSPSNEQNSLQDLNLSDDLQIVLWQGIIHPYKGIDLLLEAWKRVEESTSNSCLVIVGTGQPALIEQIRSQAARLSLHRVQMTFRFVSTEELIALYRRASIVVYPYRAITTSGALATGLALGKAIVATALPVFSELLTDRENAILVPKPSSSASGATLSTDDIDCVHALATSLTELILNPTIGEKLADKVRAMNFGDASWHSIAIKTMETYKSVLTSDRGNPHTG